MSLLLQNANLLSSTWFPHTHNCKKQNLWSPNQFLSTVLPIQPSWILVNFSQYIMYLLLYSCTDYTYIYQYLQPGSVHHTCWTTLDNRMLLNLFGNTHIELNDFYCQKYLCGDINSTQLIKFVRSN